MSGDYNSDAESANETARQLARALYERMEELDPTPNAVNFNLLSEREKSFYMHAAKAVVREYLAIQNSPTTTK